MTTIATAAAMRPRSVPGNDAIDTSLLRLTFPATDTFTKISGVLMRNHFGGGLELRAAGQDFVFGTPDVLKAFRVGDVIEVTGRISPLQNSIHQSGTNYDVAAAQAFSGSALLKDPTPADGPGDKQVLFQDGKIFAAQG